MKKRRKFEIFFQWQLAGFYDPCFGEEKFLRVVYKSADIVHQLTIKDDECLIIPKHCKLTVARGL